MSSKAIIVLQRILGVLNAFCRKLSAREGVEYRLPTEAEWEYACRAGSTSRYCFGDSDSILSEYAWYNNNSGSQTHPVGQKRPNKWGLYDMHGNVWEWCQDWHGNYASKPVIDPLGPTSGELRIGRGNSFSNVPEYCRSAFRNGYAPNVRGGGLGFRLARTSKIDDTMISSANGVGILSNKDRTTVPLLAPKTMKEVRSENIAVPLKNGAILQNSLSVAIAGIGRGPDTAGIYLAFRRISQNPILVNSLTLSIIDDRGNRYQKSLSSSDWVPPDLAALPCGFTWVVGVVIQMPRKAPISSVKIEMQPWDSLLLVL